MAVSIYSYQELFELIRIQQEKENNEKKNINQPSQMEKLFSEGLRAFNNPTSQNFKRTFNTLVNTEKKEVKPQDDRLNYVYRAP
jgi:hypothetical protein